MLNRGWQPALLEKFMLEILSLGTLCLGDDRAEQLVVHIAFFPVQNTDLGVGPDAASEILSVGDGLDAVLVLGVRESHVETRSCDGLAS